ncbi:PAS domain S-box protein [Rubellimicrobium roseum]|nr:PAS domain S-box protein [Rubellimicrobium roseum]
MNHGPALIVQDVRPLREPETSSDWTGQADFLALADTLPAPVFVSDPRGACLYANRAFTNQTGLPCDKLWGDGWLVPLHPADRARLIGSWAWAAATGEPFDIRHRLRSGDGTFRWFDSRLAPVREGGVIVRWVGTLTEVASAETPRVDEEAWYRALFEQAAVGVARVDLDGRILEANARFRSILGYSTEELRQSGFQGITHPEDLATDLDNVAALLAGRIPSYRMEKRYLTATGAEVWANLTVGLVRDVSGRPDFFVSVIEDISERRRTDDRVRASEARFRALIEHAPGKMWIARPDGTVDYFNAAWRGFTGQPQVPRRLSWLRDLHPDDRVALLADRRSAIRSGQPYSVECRIRRARDGAWRWHLGRVAPLRDERGAIFAWVGTATDIDDVRRADEERRVAARRDAFLLALEDRLRPLNDPIGMIVAAAEVLARELDVDRVCYGEVDEEADSYRIVAGRAPEVPSGVMDVTFRLAEFDPLLRALRGGAAFVCPDVQGDGRLRLAQGSAARKLSSLGAMICVPLVKNGRLDVVLSVEVGAVRDWTSEEVRLVEEVAARTWSAVERARSERRLRETEERYRLAAAATNDAIWDWQVSGDHVVWNEALRTLFGYSETATPGDWWLDRIHPEDRDRIDRDLNALVAGDGTKWSAEYRFRRADGSYADVLDRGFVQRDDQGGALRVIGAMLDMTARKAAEERLRDSEDRLRLATKAAAIGTWDFDPASGHLCWDVRCKELFGLPAEAAVTWRTFLDGLHPEDRERTTAAAEAALSPDGSGEYDIEYRTVGLADGVKRWVGAKGRCFFAEGRAVRFIGTVIDVSRARRAELELAELAAGLERRIEERTASLQETARVLETEMRHREEAQNRLLQAQKLEALGQVVGGVAHDFNNVLAAVQGAFNILSRRVTDDNLRFAIGEGRKAGDRAAALVRQMLAFARRQPAQPRVIRPETALPALEGMLRHAVGPGIAIRIDVSPGIWPVLADPHQLEVALLNLAVNARDAMPDGGTLTVSAGNLPAENAPPGEFAAGDRVAIRVTDTGCGMDEATLARAFEPFFTTKDVGKGTGLGLAQVHGVVQAGGGALQADSAPGRGTTISLVLPRSAIRAEPSEAASHGPSDLRGNARILLVDDDDQVRAITAALLRDLGHSVIEASGAAVAMAMAQIHPIDLLLTDVVMPGTDGPTLAQSLRLERPDLPVLFLTGYAAGHLLRGEKVIAKPFTGEELGRQVIEALAQPSDDTGPA